ncbi:MAG: hypothetical protein Q8S73_26240 [Deltaproteobacteria bacterium]|nr:hypothetical protein [Myxococcales bacterium]MDP3217635.1 hypothetical protein [Deltaproteobacteria bacterium]
MKYDASTRTLQFTSDQEVDRFHAEVTALLRDAVSAASHHGDARAGKLAAQAVFRDFASVLRALNVLRRHLDRSAGENEPPPPTEEGPAGDGSEG